MDVLEDISSLLSAGGDPCGFGCNEEALERIKLTLQTENPTKAMRAVKSWSLWDIEVNDAEVAELHSIGLHPIAIYASNVIWDRHGALDIGSCVRSTLLVNRPENYLCETRNTIYILVGAGTRKTVAPSLALSVFF